MARSSQTPCRLWSSRRGGSRTAPTFMQMRAFTLIEIVVVILLVSIIAVSAAPSITQAMSDIGLASAARAVLVHIRYAQSVAVAENKIILLLFDDSGYYLSEIDSMGDVARNESQVVGTLLVNPITHRPMQLSINAPGPLQGMDAINADFGGRKWIAFDTMGSPDRGGTVDLTSGGSTRRLTVAAGSGRVTVNGD